jgi:UPF0755 protein
MKVKYKLYEYPLYWLVTVILLILAIPVVIVKFLGYLVRSTGAPLKSVANLIGFLIVIAIIAVGFTAFQVFYSHDVGEATLSVMVDEDDSLSRVIDKLQEKNILRGTYLFKLMAVATGVDKGLAPGRYDFSGKVSVYDIFMKFKKKEIGTLLLTIPEGCTVYKTASLLANQLGVDSAAFVSLATDTGFSEGKYGVEGTEGYLFPETYRFWYGIRVEQIINIMVEEFHRRTDELFASLPPGSYSEKEILTLASIIESEAHDGGEKELISSVYYNRLNKNMLLQADPTVIYALGGLDRPLYYKDLEYDSPYNTYKYKGLPPGPINSPGLDAIKAAIYPANSDYLYFVADGTGRHIFSQTLAEHNRAKKKIKNEQKMTGKN